MTDISVLIPTRNRLDKITACARALSAQTLDPSRFEVLIGVDGPDTGERDGVARVLPGAQVEAFPHGGPAATRNKLVARAKGEIVLLLNDDVEPHQECLAAHVKEHQSLGGRPAMVLGAAPWRVREPDRLFDRLIRETSMIFFYDRMSASGEDRGRDHDWGFRHAWTLNLSVAREIAQAGGGFDESLRCACYEDLEWAWRLSREGVAILYRPEAIVVHDHRYEPGQYLERERMLGREALRLARASPECAREIFGCDLSAPQEIAYSREFVRRERRDVERLERSFVELARVPADVIDGSCSDLLIRLLYEQHLPIKRWHWRSGLLEADHDR